MKLVVTEPLAATEATLSILRKRVPEATIVAWPESDVPEAADLLVSFAIPPEFAALPRGLKAIFCFGAGTEKILEDRRVPADMPVIRLIDGGQGDALARYALAAAYSRLCNIDAYRLLQAERRWANRPLAAKDPARLVVAVLGLGHVGSQAARALAGAGFKTRGWSKSGCAVPGVEGFSGSDGYAAAVDGADVLLNVLPSHSRLRGLIGESTFERLAPGALVVNAGRGEHLDLDALRTSIDRLSGAWLDVFPEEPLPADHWAWSHAKIVLTPHVAGVPDPAKAGHALAEAVLALQDGGSPPGLIDRV